MICPTCGSQTGVTCTRQMGEEVQRYRKCKSPACGKVFITFEMFDRYTGRPGRPPLNKRKEPK